MKWNETLPQLLSGATTCENTVKQFLQRAEINKHLNAFLELYPDEALQRAKTLDEKRLSGKPIGKLHGMVIALKDNICYANHRVSASSKILEGYVSPYSSTVVERLLAEDAIIIGRTNCDEFAMGSSNENSAFGNVLNDADNTRVPGGSSGGSAVAVQSGMCHAALGTDTGGSIRQPAALTGTIGLKPTYGRISRYGIIAYASSLDQVGTFTNSVEDAALLIEVMCGKDERDSTTSKKEVENFSALKQNGKMKIAYIKDVLEHEGLQKDIRERTFWLIEKLKTDGHTVNAIEFPFLDYLIPTYYVIANAEASSNLARYDGMRYGYRSPNAKSLEEVYVKSRSEGFGKEVKNRIMMGTFVLSAGYYDAYYTKAMKVRRVLQNKVNEILQQYDFVLCPTSPTEAFEIGAKSKDPVAMYLSDIYTVLANLAGNPAISLPLFKSEKNLPVGIQLMSENFSEEKLLAFSKHLLEFK